MPFGGFLYYKLLNFAIRKLLQSAFSYGLTTSTDRTKKCRFRLFLILIFHVAFSSFPFNNDQY